MSSTTILNTELWKMSLGEQSEWGHDAHREKIIYAMESFGNNANVLAKEIAIDLPDFTVHDETHLDSLWEMGSLIAGPNIKLNPIEAFVFGGAVLIHDLGMASAAYANGIDNLKRGPEWEDSIELAFRQYIGRVPTKEEKENPPGEVVKNAIGSRLRALHAIQAEQIPFSEWRTEEGQSYRLLENQELLDQLGEVIGRIAASHWWSIERVGSELDQTLGAPPQYPTEWTVDCLKLACLIRVADAAHVDSRRAPSFLKVLRRPQGISGEHWVFQNRLSRPVMQNKLLTYNSVRTFGEQDMSAWWTAFDTLQMIDQEIRNVNILLKEKNHQTFEIQGVRGIDSPQNLARYILVSGWEPFDINVHVSNVKRLVKQLGGGALYGDNPYIPLRELIQNACDAIQARRTIHGLSDNWGEITVSLGKDKKGTWIEIKDNGIGMSKRILAEKLLDFGSSYWHSQLMIDEHPGLLSSGFKSVGKYGIGFYSAFMWEGSISVTSRSIYKGPDETYLLDLENDLNKRPLLKKGKMNEKLFEPGTKVRIYIPDDNFIDKIAHSLPSYHDQTIPNTIDKKLAYICRKLVPSSKVDLYCKVYDQPALKILSSNDWKEIDGASLLLRVSGYDINDAPQRLKELAQEYSRLVKPLTDEKGNILGRLAVSHQDMIKGKLNGVMTCGGLYMESTSSRIIGLIVGEVDSASRYTGIPIVTKDSLEDWATTQGVLLKKYYSTLDLSDQVELSSTIHSCGGSTGELPICNSSEGYMSYKDVVEHQWGNEIGLIQDASARIKKVHYLSKDSIAVSMGFPPFFSTGRNSWPLTIDSDFSSQTLEGLVIKAFSEKWGISKEDVINASHITSDSIKGVKWMIGRTESGIDMEDNVSIVRKPID